MRFLRSSAEKLIFLFVALVLAVRVMIVGDFGLGVPSLQIKVKQIHTEFSDTWGDRVEADVSKHEGIGMGAAAGAGAGVGAAVAEGAKAGRSPRLSKSALVAQSVRKGAAKGQPQGGSIERRQESPPAGNSARGDDERPALATHAPTPAPARRRERPAVIDDEDTGGDGDVGRGDGARGGRGHGGKRGKTPAPKPAPPPPRARKEEGASWDILDHIRLSDGLALVTHKRQFISIDQDSQLPVLHHWLEYNDFNESLVYNFPRELFEQLPLEEPKWEFNTCAVVGNSGVVLLKERGDEINDHEAVIRINMAPIRGFEPYVGKKTTFNIINSHNIKELLEGVRKWKPSSKDERLVMFETASHFARYHLCQPLLKKMPFARPVLLNPIFANRAHRMWVQLKFLLENNYKTQYNRKPMSGFFTVIFALQLCKHVDLYGFDSYTSTRRSYRYHYFDSVQGFTDVHSFDLAFEIYRLLEMKKLIKIIQ